MNKISCLKCQRNFNSEGYHNRLCNSCRRINYRMGYFLKGFKVCTGDPGRHVIHSDHDGLAISSPR